MPTINTIGALSLKENADFNTYFWDTTENTKKIVPSHDGTTFIILYDNRVTIYSLDKRYGIANEFNINAASVLEVTMDADISYDGTRVMVSFTSIDTSNEYSYVVAYQKVGSTWTLKHTETGSDSYKLGYSLSLSWADTGAVVAQRSSASGDGFVYYYGNMFNPVNGSVVRTILPQITTSITGQNIYPYDVSITNDGSYATTSIRNYPASNTKAGEIWSVTTKFSTTLPLNAKFHSMIDKKNAVNRPFTELIYSGNKDVSFETDAVMSFVRITWNLNVTNPYTYPTIVVPTFSYLTYVGETVSITVAGSTGLGTPVFSISPALPAGLFFETATARITGTSLVAQTAKTYSIAVTYNGETAVSSFSLEILQDVVLTVQSPFSMIINKAVSTQVATTTGGTSPYTYSISPALPTGLLFNTSTGTITGTPTIPAPSTTYTVTVVDAKQRTKTNPLVISIDTNLAVTVLASATFKLNTAPSVSYFTASVSGGFTPYTYSISPALPTGLTLSPTTGSISGIASQYIPTTNFTVTATDSKGYSKSGVIAITVDPLFVVSGVTSLIFNRLAISTQSVIKTVSGGTKPYTYSISPALPAGLSLNSSTGEISGQPTTTQSDTQYTVTVSDAAGLSKTFSLMLACKYVYPLRNSGATDPTNSNCLARNTSGYSYVPGVGITTTAAITDMSNMFSNKATFNDPDISTWDVSTVIDMGSMFSGTASFNQPLNNWNTTNVMNMNGMFMGASAFNQPLNNWNTANVTNIAHMFNGASAFNQPLNNWNTSKVCSITSMFADATSFNSSVAGWNLSSLVTDFTYTQLPTTPSKTLEHLPWQEYVFYNATSFNQPLNSWNTSKFTNMRYMFQGATSFNQSLNSWNTTNVTCIDAMFKDATAFNGDIGNWDTRNIVSELSSRYGYNIFAAELFYNATSFNKPLTNWKFNSSIISLLWLFQNATAFNQSLTTWDVSKIKYFDGVFYNAKSFNGDISNWNTSSATHMSGVFYGATSFNQPLNSWNTSNVINMSFMFNGTTSFNQPLNNWDTSKVVLKDNFDYMFYNASSFDQDISAWNKDMTKPVNFDTNTKSTWTIAEKPFYKNFYPLSAATDPTNPSCAARTTAGYTFIPGEGIYTKVPITDMSAMFKNMATFNDPKISTWDTSKVTNMNEMFMGATAQRQSLASWNIELVGLKPTNFDTGAGAFTGPSWYTNFYPLTAVTDPTNSAGGHRGTTGYKYVSGVGILTRAPITNMNGMFKDNTTFNDPKISTWDVSSVTSINLMFSGATSFNQPLNSWNTTNIISAYNLFDGATSFNQPLNNWNVSNVTNMTAMFKNASSFNQSLNNWNVSKVFASDPRIGMANMFNGATAFNQDISNWSVSKLYIPADFDTNTNTLWTADKKPKWGMDCFLTPNWSLIPSGITFMNRPYVAVNNAGIFFSKTTDFSDLFRNTGVNRFPELVTAIENYDTSNITNMSGMFAGTTFNGDISNWNTGKVTNMSGMFMSNTVFNKSIDNWNTANVTDMSFMFNGATLFNQPLNNWNTSNVTNMGYMFKNNASFNQPLNNWNTSNVTSMVDMFAGASSFNGNISSWDTSKVTDMGGMFNIAPAFNVNISSWNVNKVTNMINMFAGATSFDQNLYNWTPSISIGSLYYNGFDTNTKNTWILKEKPKTFSKYYPLRNTTVGPSGAVLTTTGYEFIPNDGIYTKAAITNLSSAFSGNTTFNDPDISTWDVSNVTNMNSIFRNASSFNQPLNSWDTSKVTDMDNIFNGASSFDQDISLWKVSGSYYPLYFDRGTMSTWTNNKKPIGWKGYVYLLRNSSTDPTANINRPTGYRFVANHGIRADAPFTIMSGMFQNNTTFNDPDISTWDVSTVTNMSAMFNGASAFNQPLNNWNTSNVTNMSQMLQGTTAFNQPLNNWNTANVTNMGNMFYGAIAFNQPLNNWNTANVTNMSAMFSGATAFNGDISNWNVGKVTNMSSMFYKSTAFNQSLNSWNTGLVTNMYCMFYNATAFNQPINNWVISNVTNIDYMFYSAAAFNQNLSSLYFIARTGQPYNFSSGANSNWISNRTSNFPFVNVGGIKTRIST